MNRDSLPLLTVLLLLLVVEASAQTTMRIEAVIPTPVTVTTIPNAVPVCQATPSFSGERRLADEPLARRSQSRTLLQASGLAVVQFPPDTVAIGDSFANGAGSFGCVVVAVNASITGRRLLSATPTLTFYGEVKKHLISNAAVASYLFDSSTVSYLSAMATSGATFKSSHSFLRALLMYPAEGSAINPPNFAESATGFVPTSSLKPIIVRLSTQGPADTVPSIGLRFDYSQSGTAIGGGPVTPYLSMYLTDYVGYPYGLPAVAASPTSAAVNLVQTLKWHQ